VFTNPGLGGSWKRVPGVPRRLITWVDDGPVPCDGCGRPIMRFHYWVAHMDPWAPAGVRLLCQKCVDDRWLAPQASNEAPIGDQELEQRAADESTDRG
jgi:hypothetical protein